MFITYYTLKKHKKQGFPRVLCAFAGAVRKVIFRQPFLCKKFTKIKRHDKIPL